MYSPTFLYNTEMHVMDLKKANKRKKPHLTLVINIDTLMFVH